MPRRPQWAEDLDAWEAALRAEMKPQSTVETYLETAGYAYHYAREHDWPMNPRKLTPEHVYQYYDSIQGLKSKTQSSYMFGFMALLRFVKNGTVSEMKLNISPERGEVFWLTREEVMRLLECYPSPRILAARVLWTYTGIREGEARALRKRSLTEKWLSVESGKGRRARKIPIDDEFWSMMTPFLEWREVYERKWGRNDHFLAHPLHPSRQLGPLVPYAEQGLSRLSRAHGLSIGIPHANSHPFRRQFGRDLYYNECPPTQIQRYYGHKKLEQTMEYIGVEEENDWDNMRRYRSSYRRKKP